jgi:checkpoint serine/threonine-protein kinase
MCFLWCISQSLNRLNEKSISAQSKASRKVTINPRTGRAECVFVDVEAVYPQGMEQGEEFSFEELRARSRGLLKRDWSGEVGKAKEQAVESNHDATCHLNLPIREEPRGASGGEISNLPQMVRLKDESNLSKKLKKEDKANKTRKIIVMEVKAETQTGE